MATIKNIFLVTLLFSFGIELYAERPASDQADEDKFGNKHDWCAEVNYDHTLIIVDTTEKFNENQYELLFIADDIYPENERRSPNNWTLNPIPSF